MQSRIMCMAVSLVLLVTASGCSTIYEVGAGYATAPATHRQAMAVEVRDAEGGDKSPWMFDMTARARFGEREAQAALGVGFLLRTQPLGEHWMLRWNAGVHVLEMGYLDHAFAAGMGTPYTQASLTWLFATQEREQNWNFSGFTPAEFHEICVPPPSRWATRRSWGVTVSAGVEYDVRFTPAQSNEVVWTVTLGVTRFERDVELPPGPAVPTEACLREQLTPARLEAPFPPPAANTP